MEEVKRPQSALDFIESRSKEPYDMSYGLYVDAGGLDEKLLVKERNEMNNIPEEKSI